MTPCIRSKALALSVLATVPMCAQVPAVVLTGAPDLASTVRQLEDLRAQGMQVQVIVGPGTCIGTLPDEPAVEPFAQATGSQVLTPRHSLRPATELTGPQRVAQRWLNELVNGTLDGPANRAPMDWSAHPEPERRATESAPVDRALPRSQGMAPVLNWTCGNGQNTERMEGTVAACVFFTESDGSIDADLYSWSPSAIADVELQLIDAWTIWSYTASLYGVTVTAVMDWYEPSGGVPVQGYEPIQHPSSDDHLWIEACMDHLGLPVGSAFSRLNTFHIGRRQALGTDHAYSCFIAYNPPAEGAPNQMADGAIGYAYLGGPYTQILYKANGWSTGQIDRVYGHETGHIFHAFDEYSSSTPSNCTRSFNGQQNLNYHGSSCNGTTSCVMVDNSYSGSGATRHWNLCAHSPVHLGWGTLVPQASLEAPINDSILTALPVVLRWAPENLPVGTYGYVQVFNSDSQEREYCGYAGSNDTLALSMVNGNYTWMVGQGNASTTNGYAGITSAVAYFSVNSALNADFTASASTICAGASVQYTDASTGAPSSWQWDFPGGDPTTFNGQTPPPVHYPTMGVWDARLIVGDGNTMDTLLLPNAITVEGGEAIPYEQGFEVGFFPPQDWTIGTGGGQGGMLSWSADAFVSCGMPTAAYVNAHAFSGTFASTTLTSPKLDLTAVHWPYLRFRHAYAQESSSVTETLDIAGHSCDYSAYQQVFQASGADLATNGGAYVNGPAWYPSSCSDWTTTWVRLDSLIGRTALFDFTIQTTGGQNFYLDDIAVFDGILVSPRVILQGAYDNNLGLMRDDLRTEGLVPLTEPYSAAGYQFMCEGGGETISPDVLAITGTQAIVDWVLVELRDPDDPTSVVCSRAALLQRDGDIVDVDGVSPVRFATPEGDDYLVVRHRNHLGVMTAAPVTLGPTTTLVDLSDPAILTYGTNARRITGNLAMLWAGNTNGDTLLKYTGMNNDRDPILVQLGGQIPTNTAIGYLLEDVTMDGVVKYTGSLNDRDMILVNIGGAVPTNFFIEQLP